MGPVDGVSGPTTHEYQPDSEKWVVRPVLEDLKLYEPVPLLGLGVVSSLVMTWWEFSTPIVSLSVTLGFPTLRLTS